MVINDLRNIGTKLLEMVPRCRFAEDARVAIKKGASGDRTFPMDREAEEIILTSLEGLNEPFHIVSEESGIKYIGSGGMTVLVDPIDGSKNAVSGLPLFSTSIAVADGNRIGDIVMGYVINLVSGDEFWAERGQGAFLNGRQIHAQEPDDLFLALYEVRNPGRDLPEIMPLLSLFNKTRCLGSVAVDLASIAMGAASVFVNPVPSRVYDYGGGWLLIREAGGIFTDMDGDPLDDVEIGMGRSAPLLASANEKIHNRVLGVIHEK